MNIDWKRKLSSRKFWAAAVAWLTSVMTAFGAGGESIARMSAVMSGVAALVVYILSEAYIDGKNAQGRIDVNHD